MVFLWSPVTESLCPIPFEPFIPSVAPRLAAAERMAEMPYTTVPLCISDPCVWRLYLIRMQMSSSCRARTRDSACLSTIVKRRATICYKSVTEVTFTQSSWHGRTADKIARIIPDRLIVFPVLRRTFAAIYKRGESRVTEQSAPEVGRRRRSGKAVGKRKEPALHPPLWPPAMSGSRKYHLFY